jgi:hypothetical protein
MHMPNRIAKFAPAILASFLAGTALTAASDNAARAADDCLSGPKEQTPEGYHWYYRIDRATKRHCWYLREESDKLARAAPQDSAPSTNPVSPPKAATAQRSVADAYAELPPPQTRIEQTNGVPAWQQSSATTTNIAGSENSQRAGAGDADRQPSVVASRWPGTSSGVSPPANPAPAPVASIAAAPSNATVASLPAVAAVPLAAADASSGKPSGSIAMLLTVVLGALSVAGLTGSAIFRFGRLRRMRRRQMRGNRRVIWDSIDGNSGLPPAHPHSRVNHDGIGERRGRRAPDDPNERMAAFLAQLSRQAPT